MVQVPQAGLPVPGIPPVAVAPVPAAVPAANGNGQGGAGGPGGGGGGGGPGGHPAAGQPPIRGLTAQEMLHNALDAASWIVIMGLAVAFAVFLMALAWHLLTKPDKVSRHTHDYSGFPDYCKF